MSFEVKEMDVAKKFFDACELGRGWSVCKQFCEPNAVFESQADPLLAIKTLEAYTEWMAGFAKDTAPGCSYDIHHSSWDPSHKSAAFFATFHGTHTGPQPCAPTGKSTNSHYAYIICLGKNGKIIKMTKVWNSHYAMRELGWVE